MSIYFGVSPSAFLWSLQQVLTLCGTDVGSHSTTIHILPDNVLLEVFDFYQYSSDNTGRAVWKWHLLVHVCRRWRQIVFASPHRLNLQILCTTGTRVRENLCIWPTLPIAIEYRYSERAIRPRGAEDNVIAALKHRDRICDVSLDIQGSQLAKVATVMKKPFPVLTRLHVTSDPDDRNVPILPREFLGRSAPCLQKITLSGIPYPTLPKLLLSTSNLVALELRRIPPTGYISPLVIATCLAALPKLDAFDIQFQSATLHHERIFPPVTRDVLPSLTAFTFKGASEYLEDLVARIDSPQLDRILVVYLNQAVEFQVAQLSRFIVRSAAFKANPLKHAQATFSDDKVSFDMCRHELNRHELHPTPCRPPTRIVVSCRGIDWQVPHIAQVLGQFSATLSNVVRLKFESTDKLLPDDHSKIDGADVTEWLLLLRQFSAVQTLHVSEELAKHVSLALEGITQEMIAGFLPSINLIDLRGPPASSFEKFVALRGLSGHPVTIVDLRMEREREERREMERREMRERLMKMQTESERNMESPWVRKWVRKREPRVRVRDCKWGWGWELESWRTSGREEWEINAERNEWEWERQAEGEEWEWERQVEGEE